MFIQNVSYHEVQRGTHRRVRSPGRTTGERTWQGTRGYTWNDDRKYVPPCGQRQAPARDFFRH